MLNILLIFYNCLLLIFLVPILLAIVLAGKKNRQEFFYCIKERLSCWNIPQLDKNKKTVWIHCASLGEAKAVEPMIPFLKDYNIIVSTITKSAREYVAKIKGISYFALAPVDVYPFIASILKKIKPDVLILIETEFWPSMITCANKLGTKIITVNGRISKGAFPYYKLTKFFWKPFLNLITYISVRNKHDYKRFLALTDNKDKIGITGNIKYDRDFTSETITKENLFLADNDLILTAGSTREGEETILLKSFVQLKNTFTNLKLIIAPRHIARVNEICSLIKKNNLSFELFSKLTDSKKDVIIIDVFGKLQTIYSISDIVFIGGSIVNKGGQNPIEAAAYSKPIIFGKYMYNFESESASLKNNGAFEINNQKEFVDTATKLLNDINLRQETGKKALEVVKSQKGAIEKNIKIVKEYL
jgi:3-deoxy-D-manno-octulosonic-acid transferase